MCCLFSRQVETKDLKVVPEFSQRACQKSFRKMKAAVKAPMCLIHVSTFSVSSNGKLQDLAWGEMQRKVCSTITDVSCT